MTGLYDPTMTVLICSSITFRLTKPTLANEDDKTSTNETKQEANILPLLPEHTVYTSLAEYTEETGGTSNRVLVSFISDLLFRYIKCTVRARLDFDLAE